MANADRFLQRRRSFRVRGRAIHDVDSTEAQAAINAQGEIDPTSKHACAAERCTTRTAPDVVACSASSGRSLTSTC